MDLLKKIQLIKLAKAHYLEGKPKNQIADEFGLSRFKVARLLDEATDNGIVKFVIPDLEGYRTDLSDELEKKYRLKHCTVIASPSLASDSLIDSLSSTGAELLQELGPNVANIGVASGRVLSAIADKLTVFPKCNVVQAAGVQEGMNFRHSSLEIVHRLAGLGDGRPFPLLAPMWLEKVETAESMKLEASIQELHMLYSKLDILITGIGSWCGEGSSGMYGTISTHYREDLISKGATADLCSVILDINGNELVTGADSLSLALKPQDIRNIPEVIAIAGGNDKHKAIRACLLGEWVSTLITDEGTAKYLLDN
ncbi:hypothetical protein BCU70_05270 [Vibrio sp. 10N.286.49.C2]|uniref:sugar-binding transcriptional regulator n=1 Tax=unclassified Vibrio TaxID=2614977 RepID=UPI000C864002|nr:MULTISPECIES: sugar-binding domain-containing protein [unclassified Vibrio]PMH33891.1 hypothetical protein BCU70_05270 [Vibrio sp. 10N.286.49.C2]PMH44149.1 hypothetical protein BCU66_04180 [Vibrio sp. 10N.286.49.B1]PMH78338.1 hypothetical protein BCU58_09430 [Vibrio sp. 10N.286.48.B7]